MKKTLALTLFLVVLTSIAFATSMLPKEVALDEGSNGKEFTLFVGQTLALSLSENPSTGYRWTVEGYQPKLLEQLDTVVKPGTRPGQAGTKIFGFLAKRVGRCDLELEYQRPWAENVPAAKTFVLHLEVKKAGSPHSTQMADSPRPGPLMNLGQNLGQLATLLADLKGPELACTSAVEFRPGANKEYAGFLLLTDPKQTPRCPHDKLPMNNQALKAMVQNLLTHYGKKANSKELGFLLGGFSPPGFTQVTLVGTGLGLYFNTQTGAPMGKLTGKL